MGDFKNSRKSMERSSTQKVPAGLKWHIRANGANLYININIWVCVWAFQLKAAKYTFFSQMDIKQFPGLSTYCATKQREVNLIKLET